MESGICMIIAGAGKFSNNFVLNNPFSMASVYAFIRNIKIKRYVIRDFQTMRTAASALNSIYPNSESGKSLIRKYSAIFTGSKSCQSETVYSGKWQNSPDICYLILMEKKLHFLR